MKIEKIQIGNKKVMPFTIPSGIVMTEVSCAEKLLREIPEIGIWSTKSTGLNERVMPTEELLLNNSLGLEFGCREPILVKIGDGTYANAVKLINDGAIKTREKIERASIPKDRVILTSVFAEKESKLVEIVRVLEPVADAFEWNGGCPHGEKIGMAQGQDPRVVYSFIKTITDVSKKPVFFKAPANVTGECVKAAVDAGAYGVAGINTVPVEPLDEEGKYLLWNKKGGKSGRGIKEIGLEKVREMRKAGGDITLIVMAGISTARDIEDYAEAASGGPIVYGIGSATAGMDDKELSNYFRTIVEDVRNGTNNAEGLLKKVDMTRRKVRIRKITNQNCDFKIYETDISLNSLPGQFVFAGISEIGEKPFSVMDDDPLTLGVLSRGIFTKQFNSLREGDSFYIKGPYGKGVDVPENSDVVLAGGGCGIAGVYFLAKSLSKKSNLLTLLAAKDREHIPYLDLFKKYGEVEIATENGSIGRKGLITDIMRNLRLKNGSYFFNCGPKAMVNAVLPLELEVSIPERIYSSADYMTRCGVGIDGSCANEKGRRTCVEGPFINAE